MFMQIILCPDGMSVDVSEVISHAAYYSYSYLISYP